MISFIIPYRNNRFNHLEHLEKNISSYYKSYELIIAEQNDEEQFKRGQLLNLGFKKSSGDMLVFMDVDVRFMGALDFYGLMKKSGKPYLPWDHRQQINENGPNSFEIIKDECYYCTQGFGGMTVFTPQQFKNCYGFSNMFCGWGAEDTLLNMRVKGIKRFPGNLYHIKHPSYMKEFDPTKDKYTIHNRKVLDLYKNGKYSSNSDSYVHTIAKVSVKSETNSYKHYCFTEFGVSSDCPYADFVSKIYKSEAQ